MEVPQVKFRDIFSKGEGETSDKIRERVTRARARQVERFRGLKLFANAQMSTKEIKKFCPAGPDCQKLLEMAVTRLGLSARAYDRILTVARIIAGLAGEDDISPAHISEAIQYRMMDRYY